MPDTYITRESLKKLSHIETCYNSLIREAVEKIKTLSETWLASLKQVQNSENVPQDKFNEIFNHLKQLLNARKKADEIIKEYQNAQISVTENIKSDILQNISSLHPDDFMSKIKAEALNNDSSPDNTQITKPLCVDDIISMINIILAPNFNIPENHYPKQAEDNFLLIDKIISEKKQELLQWLFDLDVIDKQRSNIRAVTKRVNASTFGTSKVEGLAFDPTKNPAIYDTLLPVRIDVSRRKSNRKKIETLFSIDFSDLKKEGVSIAFEYRITPYDREIHNAIATLASMGNEYINPSMIFQLISGNSGNSNISQETRKNIISSIDKMMATLVTIDASAEVNANMITKTTGIYKGALIPAERVEVMEINGQKVHDCIHLLRTPPLYDYARDKNQIGSIDIKMLDTPLSNTSENIELKGYLLRRIAGIKNSKNNMSATIRYDTLYAYLRLDNPNTHKDRLLHKHKEVRRKVKVLLEFWIEKGLIKSYTEEKESKSIAKVSIFI